MSNLKASWARYIATVAGGRRSKQKRTELHLSWPLKISNWARNRWKAGDGKNPCWMQYSNSVRRINRVSPPDLESRIILPSGTAPLISLRKTRSTELLNKIWSHMTRDNELCTIFKNLAPIKTVVNENRHKGAVRLEFITKYSLHQWAGTINRLRRSETKTWRISTWPFD